MSSYNGFNTMYHVPETGEYLYGDAARASHQSSMRRKGLMKCSYVLQNGPAIAKSVEDDGRRSFFSTKRGDFFSRKKAEEYISRNPHLGPIKEVFFYIPKVQRERDAALRKAELSNLRLMQEQTVEEELPLYTDSDNE